MEGPRRARLCRAATGALLVLAAIPAAALGAFPGQNPDESVRQNTPNDPRFDRCEPDDESGTSCSNVFEEQFERFGFAPSGTQFTATYRAGDTRRQQQQNTLAGRNPSGQLPGVSADRAWKLSTGHPEVEVAIFDTGFNWSRASLRRKIALNERELPTPQRAGGTCTSDDCNGVGALDVEEVSDD